MSLNQSHNINDCQGKMCELCVDMERALKYTPHLNIGSSTVNELNINPHFKDLNYQQVFQNSTTSSLGYEEVKYTPLELEQELEKLHSVLMFLQSYASLTNDACTSVLKCPLIPYGNDLRISAIRIMMNLDDLLFSSQILEIQLKKRLKK